MITKIVNEMSMSMFNLSPYESFETKPMKLQQAKNILNKSKKKTKLKLTNNSQ